jgi:phospholipase C
VVVLVMENRSFDHMLGWMKRLNPEIDGVTGREWNPANASDPAAGRVYFRDGAAYVDPDPGHSFQEIRQQVFGSDDDAADNPPRMDGFAQQARSIGGGAMSDAVMRGFNPADVAVYRELVSQFAVCDRWFASVPSSTQPNRLFVHSGTSGGATSNNPTYVLALHPTFTFFCPPAPRLFQFLAVFNDFPSSSWHSYIVIATSYYCASFIIID